ncbi:unnamed protein product [Protopolystoma xenopodis]|uniref:Uncharacterized protein n=1 Tax=Protopolystoma xenopodis TaxID=117903 RepID=A0A3S5B9F7_9PLAT|nr:unnamed protein product [Protopolystoma xenopodis]
MSAPVTTSFFPEFSAQNENDAALLTPISLTPYNTSMTKEVYPEDVVQDQIHFFLPNQTISRSPSPADTSHLIMPEGDFDYQDGVARSSMPRAHANVSSASVASSLDAMSPGRDRSFIHELIAPPTLPTNGQADMAHFSGQFQSGPSPLTVALSDTPDFPKLSPDPLQHNHFLQPHFLPTGRQDDLTYPDNSHVQAQISVYSDSTCPDRPENMPISSFVCSAASALNRSSIEMNFDQSSLLEASAIMPDYSDVLSSLSHLTRTHSGTTARLCPSPLQTINEDPLTTNQTQSLLPISAYHNAGMPQFGHVTVSQAANVASDGSIAISLNPTKQPQHGVSDLGLGTSVSVSSSCTIGSSSTRSVSATRQKTNDVIMSKSHHDFGRPRKPDKASARMLSLVQQPSSSTNAVNRESLEMMKTRSVLSKLMIILTTYLGSLGIFLSHILLILQCQVMRSGKIKLYEEKLGFEESLVS